jgi:hypothetical protein
MNSSCDIVTQNTIRLGHSNARIAVSNRVQGMYLTLALFCNPPHILCLRTLTQSVLLTSSKTYRAVWCTFLNLCRTWGPHSGSYENCHFWDIALCSPYTNRRLGGIYHLHLQGRNLAEQETNESRCLLLGWFSFLKMEVILSTETSVYIRTTGAISQNTVIFIF